MAVEHRAGAEFRVSGRTLSGVVMRYGDIAPEHGERFEPGAFAPVPAVPMRLQHDARMEILPAGGFILKDSPRELCIRADLPADSAALALTRRGACGGWSVGFHAREERHESGIRVVSKAALVEVSLCDSGSYPASKAEVRAHRARSGRTLRSKVPYDLDLACECIAKSGQGSGGACIPLARFTKMSGDLMAETIADALGSVDQILNSRDVLAVAGDYKRALGSASRGTLRAKSTDTGLDLEIDIPTGTVGDDLVAAHESSGVILRPLIDMDRSEFVDGARGREYSKPFLKAILVGPTDSKEGWPVPRLEYDGDRAAPAPERRRRAWL